MTKEEKMAILGRITRMCAPKENDRHGLLDVISEDTGKSIAGVLNVAIKAISEDNKMQGHLAPQKFAVEDIKHIEDSVKQRSLAILHDKNTV